MTPPKQSEKVTTDDDGEPVSIGDTVSFSYGIPPIGVKAPVIQRDGKLIVLTPEHNPTECALGDLSKFVGNFYKEQKR